MKYQLTLKPQNFPFNQTPRFAEIDADNILLDNAQLPPEIDVSDRYNPQNIRLWVIGNEHGPICAVFAGCEQYAFDQAVDLHQLDCLLADDQEYDNETLTPLGNASELFDLSHAWIAEVEFDAARDIQLIVAIVKARAECLDNLGEL